ncbi:hypothetical protein DB313_05350 (plasmid) [Borrelia turcica IST7]|uniref:Uncharacterized protein n=1 Tax=Borrelia turcica IST7 TaxID=1104446 RepID=A0A386PN32_9SPIR|nr:hypothetical protein [Borrelia turcica]AYE36926.1 hypothetical protein DB313_05350 [Borrelia turcica IST7]
MSSSSHQDSINTEFEIYRAKYLNLIDNQNIHNEVTKNYYEFRISKLYRLYKIAQEAHNKFFWHLWI